MDSEDVAAAATTTHIGDKDKATVAAIIEETVDNCCILPCGAVLVNILPHSKHPPCHEQQQPRKGGGDPDCCW